MLENVTIRLHYLRTEFFVIKWQKIHCINIATLQKHSADSSPESGFGTVVVVFRGWPSIRILVSLSSNHDANV